MDEVKELVELAGRIAEFQARKGWNNTQMCRRFPDLGTSKTFGACQEGALEGYDIERWVVQYRAVWAVIESMDGAEEATEPLYDDLSPVLNLRRALLETFREAGNARVIVVQGEPGVGKTRTIEVTREKYGARILVVEVTEAWEDSVMALLGAILAAFGVQEPPNGRAERLELCVRRLQDTRRCLVLDEAHHLGPKTLNTIKTLVNRTPGEFVLLALPRLWRKLERAAYEECRQLTTNRLAERIKLGLQRGDIQKMLTRRVPGLNGGAATAAKMLLSRAPQFGNLAYVRDVAKRLAAHEGEVTVEDVAAAMAAEEGSR